MIKVRLKGGKSGEVCGFLIKWHATGIVCSAVSALAFNTVNSIDELTSAKCKVAMPRKGGGYLDVYVPEIDSGSCQDASILMKAFVIGITGIKKEYPKEIKIKQDKTR
ncbi:MAG: ribosomal-processing cysteine protease Prp [Clostridiales bacterium]|jgi:uncharacterized protein YsxB (DUF464 family)|nr:ribosomal-processing cysteine protease Prp [Clostridiales bacterium]MDR2750980.1 ribosomal-processing cysteine protease Prp [Clostridiales bacterium]